jgi:hypothetical protein
VIAGTLVEAMGSAAASLDRLLAQASGAGRTWSGEGRPSAYADAMLEAVDAAHLHARGVIIAVSPIETDVQAANFQALNERIRSRLLTDRWLRWVDLGEVPELRQAALRLDGWNYGASASSLAGAKIGPAILDLIFAR